MTIELEIIMKKYAFVLLALLILSACSGGNSEFVTGTWKRVSYGNPANPAVAVSDVETSIEFKDGQVNGNVGCNGFSGKYEVEGDKITFNEVMSTLMLCEGPVGDQETTTLNVLHKIASFALDGDTLTLTSADSGSVI